MVLAAKAEPTELLAIREGGQNILRRIETKEGAYRDVGSLLAILSSEEHGPADLLAEAEASEFRIVANLAE